MDKHEKRLLRATSFTRHLTEQLRDEPVQLGQTTPLKEFGVNLDTPVGAYRGARESRWAAAEQGNAGTGRPISQIHGEPKMKAMRANIAGGTKANGGPGEVGAAAVLRKDGWSAAGTSLAGWGLVVGCEVVLTIGPPVITALWKANQDVRAAAGAERKTSSDES